MEILQSSFEFIFSEWHYAFLFFFLFFNGLYWLGVGLSNLLIKFLKQKNKIYAIHNARKNGQISSEIRYSTLSIFVFSVQAIPMQYLIQKGIFTIDFDWSWVVLWEIPLLFFWNELHFYTVHWLMHQKPLYQKIHFIHHKSKEPTVYSIYSFHWIEAFLLGTVIFFPLAAHTFNIISILSLPVMSIILNLAGHCNYEPKRFKDKNSIWRFTFRHTMHHKYGKGNFGFMLNWFDKIFKTEVRT